MEEVRSYWNMRSHNYDTQIGPQYETAYRQTAERTLTYLKPEDCILEFACGTGIVTFLLAPHVKAIHAIDVSEEMIVQAEEKRAEIGAMNVTVERLDIFDESLRPGSFDAVAAYNVLLYLPNRVEVLARIRELLKPGGMFLSASDCLGERITRVGIRKWWRSHTGKMPYVAFDTCEGLERAVAAAGFTVLETKNLFPSPPNLFIAAKKAK